MRYHINKLVFSFLIITSAIQLPAAEKEFSWTPEVIMQTKTISDIQISPDNGSVLFVVTESKIGEEKGTLVSRIYKKNYLKEETPLPITDSNAFSMQPKWSPDGQWIAFLSIRENSKQLYLLHSNEGEARALTDGMKDVQTFCWSPDGKKIAFVMSDELESAKNEKKSSLAYVFNKITTVNRLWIIDIFSSDLTPKALTSDEYCVRGCGDFGTTNVEFDWSPDSKKITFAYSPTAEHDDLFLDSSLATTDVMTGKTIALEKKALHESMPRYSPDGRWIAYASGNSPQRYAFDRQIAIYSTEGTEHRFLSPTFNEGSFLAGPNLLGWTKDGNSVLFYEPKETKFHLVQIPVDGSPAKAVETGDFFFKEPALSYDRSMIGFVAQTPVTPPEAFIAKMDNFVPIQISSVNQRLLSYPKTETEIITWTAKDGMNIQGLLTYPLNYDETKQYPLLLVLHGGPMSFFDETFLGTPNPYPLACFAQAGFMIFRPNPRGSCGYGKEFRSANYNDWGGADFADIMSGVDMLIDKGVVDSNKLGIMGWSYGGYMTAWTITQTSRFKAASVGAGLSNLVSMNGATDLPRFLTDCLGDYSTHRTFYENRSPINFVTHVTTPCLIQHGTDDVRVPVSQAYEFYHALNRAGKETQLVLYPGMKHHLCDPNMQLDAMKRNLDWFQKHLLDGH